MNKTKKNSHKAAKDHIKKGDTVVVLAGNDKDKRGVVQRIIPETYRAIVEGVHQVLRHVKKTQGQPEGKIYAMNAPIHMSNLMLVDPATDKPTRVGRKSNEKGKLQRYAKTTGAFIHETAKT